MTLGEILVYVVYLVGMGTIAGSALIDTLKALRGE
jgi:hypothetical protein